LKRVFALNLRTHFITLICAGLLLAGVLQMGSVSVEASQKKWTSLSGNYLAGREASLSRDDEQAADFFMRALKSDPENKILLESTLLILLKTGSYDQAEDMAKRLVKLDKTSVNGGNYLALRALKKKDYEQALSFVKGEGTSPIGKISSSLIKAWAHVGNKQIDKALGVMEELKAYDNFTTFRLYHTALIHDVSNNKEEADRFYKEAYEEASQFLDLILSYGAFLEKHNQTTKAVQLYETYLKKNAENSVVERVLKNAVSNKRNSSLVSSVRQGAAEAMFNISRATVYEASTLDTSLVFLRLSLYLNKKNDMAQNQMGQIYELTKNYEKAIKAYEAVPGNSPLHIGAVIEIAENLNRLERKRQARLKLKFLTLKRSEDLRPVYGLANLLRFQQKYRAASKAYSRALRLIDTYENHHWNIFYYRGISYERTKKWDLAEKDFLKALELEPDQPDVLNYLGYSWIEQKKNLKQAMGMIEKANKFKPNDGYIIDSLGWAHFKIGNFEKAAEILEQAIYFKPEDPIINDHLGDAYWEVGRRLEAGFQWNHAKFQLDKRIEEKSTSDDLKLLKNVEKKIAEKSTPYAKNLKQNNQTTQGKPL